MNIRLRTTIQSTETQTANLGINKVHEHEGTGPGRQGAK